MDMQTERGDGTELFYARCAVLHAARYAKIDAFDVVFPDVNDDDGFLKEVELIKRLGFNGKSLINPRQIELLHNAFAPDRGRGRLRQAHHRAPPRRANARGMGVVSLNGKHGRCAGHRSMRAGWSQRAAASGLKEIGMLPCRTRATNV